MEHFLNLLDLADVSICWRAQRKGSERSVETRKVIGRCHGRYTSRRPVAARADAADSAC